MTIVSKGGIEGSAEGPEELLKLTHPMARRGYWVPTLLCLLMLPRRLPLPEDTCGSDVPALLRNCLSLPIIFGW